MFRSNCFFDYDQRIGTQTARRIICPKCHDADTRLSRQLKWRDALHKSEEAWRCRNCRHRFYVAGPRSAAVDEPANRQLAHRKRRQRPWWRQGPVLGLGLLAIALVIVFFLVKFMLEPPRGAVNVLHPGAPQRVTPA